MIDRALNRDSVLGMALQLIDHGGRLSPDDAAELERALAALDAAVAAEPPLGDAVDPESRKTYMPSDMALALLQARYEQRLDDAPGELVTTVGEEAGPLADEQVTTTGVAEGWGDFDDTDPKWVIGFLGELAQHLDDRKKFKLPDSPPRAARLEDDARVVLVGDWGTGGRIADAVAAGIRGELAAAVGRQTHVVHLGDVYYAGTKWEAQHRFLPHWPVHDGEAALSWCLNANHDMYAAGEGLFEVILRDGRFAHQVTDDGRPTSEFALVGDHWQILGLDSAWKLLGHELDDLRGHAGFLGDEQVARLEAVAGPRRDSTILLSHHQPFTREKAGVEPVGNLLEATAGVRDGDGLKAWFWGHEHRCMTFGGRSGIEYPACVGHGAIPVEDKPSLAEPPEWELTQTYEDKDGDTWRMSGFAVLDFEPERFTVRYVDHEGRDSKPPEVVTRG